MLKWEKFMFIWFSIFKYDYVALFNTTVPIIFRGQWEAIEQVWFAKEFLYTKNSLDLIVWDVCRLAEANHYVYNLYTIDSYNIYHIDEHFDTIYILYYDLFLIYFLIILKF